MSTMSVSLPDGLTSFEDEQVATRGYRTSSEYVRELIRRDRDRQPFEPAAVVGEIRQSIDAFLGDAVISRHLHPADDLRARVDQTRHPTGEAYVCAQHELFYRTPIEGDFASDGWRPALGGCVSTRRSSTSPAARRFPPADGSGTRGRAGRRPATGGRDSDGRGRVFRRCHPERPRTGATGLAPRPDRDTVSRQRPTQEETIWRDGSECGSV